MYIYILKETSIQFEFVLKGHSSSEMNVFREEVPLFSYEGIKGDCHTLYIYIHIYLYLHTYIYYNKIRHSLNKYLTKNSLN